MVITMQVEERKERRKASRKSGRKKMNDRREEKQHGLVTEWKTTIDEQNDNKTNSKAITNNC